MLLRPPLAERLGGRPRQVAARRPARQGRRERHDPPRLPPTGALVDGADVHARRAGRASTCARCASTSRRCWCGCAPRRSRRRGRTRACRRRKRSRWPLRRGLRDLVRRVRVNLQPAGYGSRDLWAACNRSSERRASTWTELHHAAGHDPGLALTSNCIERRAVAEDLPTPASPRRDPGWRTASGVARRRLAGAGYHHRVDGGAGVLLLRAGVRR